MLVILCLKYASEHTQKFILFLSRLLTVETRILKKLITVPAQVKSVQNPMTLKLRLCVRILLNTWMYVCSIPCLVVRCRPCDGLITLPRNPAKRLQTYETNFTTKRGTICLSETLVRFYQTRGRHILED